MNRAVEGQGKKSAALEGGAAARFTAAWLCFAALLCVCGTAAAQGTPLGEPVWVPLRTSPAYCADPSPVEIEVTGENTDRVTVEVEGRVAYLADGSGVTVLDLGDPDAPEERARLGYWSPIRAVEVSPGEGRLYALSAGRLRVLDIDANPFAPVEDGSIWIAGLLDSAMRSEGRWVYLNGLWTQTVRDDPRLGLSREGGHELRPWVAGRELRGDGAERVRPLANRYELWKEVE